MFTNLVTFSAQFVNNKNAKEFFVLFYKQNSYAFVHSRPENRTDDPMK